MKRRLCLLLPRLKDEESDKVAGMLFDGAYGKDLWPVLLTDDARLKDEALKCRGLILARDMDLGVE